MPLRVSLYLVQACDTRVKDNWKLRKACTSSCAKAGADITNNIAKNKLLNSFLLIITRSEISVSKCNNWPLHCMSCKYTGNRWKIFLKKRKKGPGKGPSHIEDKRERVIVFSFVPVWYRLYCRAYFLAVCCIYIMRILQLLQASGWWRIRLSFSYLLLFLLLFCFDDTKMRWGWFIAKYLAWVNSVFVTV